MTARTHDAFAFSSLVVAATYYPPDNLSVGTLFAAVIGNIVGSLIPDMDQSTNRLWDLLPMGEQLGKVFRRVFISHRSLSHSILGFYLIYKFLEWLLPKVLNPLYIDASIVFLAVIVGYASHLMADSLTKEGLPLLFPFKFKFGIPPFSSLRIATGSWAEKFIVLPAVTLFLFLFINSNKDALIGILNLVVGG
jgi:inner membrane protein